MAIFQLNKTTQTTQTKIASQLGVTQGAISQATLNKRNIFVVEDEQGISAFELKPVFNTNPDLDKISGILLQQLEVARKNERL